MAHYAILDENNIVINIIVGRDENDELPENYISWEQYYGGKRCSYNTVANKHMNNGIPFRGNFPAVGYKYDKDFNAFYAPQPYPSWKMNYNTFIWEAPISMPEITPNDNFTWVWSEPNKEWIKVSI